MAAQLVDIAALEEYLDNDDDDSYDDSDDNSSYYSSDEDSVDCVSDPILDPFQEKILVNDLKQKARARRLKRKESKKDMKKAETSLNNKKEAQEEDLDTTEEESFVSYYSHLVDDVHDDDSIKTHLGRLNLETAEDSLDVEEDGEFDDFGEEEEEEVEIELPLELKEQPASTTKSKK